MTSLYAFNYIRCKVMSHNPFHTSTSPFHTVKSKTLGCLVLFNDLCGGLNE